MARRVRQAHPASQTPRETAKDRLIAELITARENILSAVTRLSPRQQDEVFLGEWSVKDLLAHLIGWDYTYIAAMQDLEAGELPSFYSAYDPDWAGYNRNLVRQYKQDDWTELLSAVQQSRRQLLDYLQTLPDEEFGEDRGVRYRGTAVTIARLIEVETKDEREHYDQIRQWAG